MTTSERSWKGQGEGWEHLGRAAEHLARRLARDARRFAERVETHVGEFAHDVRHRWRCGERTGGHGGSADDVRRVFDDVRGMLAAVLDGVDELITGVFHERAESSWTRVVLNREATCGGCARTLAAGDEGFVRRRPGGAEIRCLTCGVPGESRPPS